jgi:hypothetical protein
MNRRGLLAVFGTLGVIALVAVAIAAQGSGGGGAPPPGTSALTTSASSPQGDPREKNTGPVAVPGAGRLAGPPLRTARRFVSVWLNRSASAAALRRQRPILVGLSVGNFAQLMEVTIEDALASGEFGPENEGGVEFAKLEEFSPQRASVLLVCRERPQGGSLTYTTYLARLTAVAPGRFAISDLEPQP